MTEPAKHPSFKSSLLQRIWPILIELWLAFVVGAFLVTRIFGSRSWQHLLQMLARH